MTKPIRLSLAAAAIALMAAPTLAGDAERDAILQGYAGEAAAEDSSFSGFSAERGESLYMGPHQGGNPETAACAACHTVDPTAEGRHRKTGRAIEPMAVSANPARFTDLEEVEKQFARDCKNVLGRACTAQEKGDFITFLLGK